MNTKSKIWNCIWAVVVVFSFVVTSCKKDKEKEEFTRVVTTEVHDVTSTSALSGGSVTTNVNDKIMANGVCWSISPNPLITDNKSVDYKTNNGFTSNLTGLSPNVTYYVRAYSTNTAGTTYGNELSFTTPMSLPVLITTHISNINVPTALSGGTIVTDGASAVTARGVCWSNLHTPTIADNKTDDGTGIGSFNSTLTNLFPNQTYYFRAYATNSVGTSYGQLQKFDIPEREGNFVTDVDGNVYSTIKIGTQTWMAENLRVTHYRNGSPITNATDNTSWIVPFNLTEAYNGRYCYYNNDIKNAVPFGCLYNGSAVVDTNWIAPKGWHIPNYDEFRVLENYSSALWGEYGWDMAIEDTSYICYDWRGNNLSGFKAMNAGVRNYKGEFYGLGEECWWPFYWSRKINVIGLFIWQIRPHYNNDSTSYSRPDIGRSIRCIKD